MPPLSDPDLEKRRLDFEERKWAEELDMRRAEIFTQQQMRQAELDAQQALREAELAAQLNSNKNVCVCNLKIQIVLRLK